MHIFILGAGIGGTVAAYNLRHKLDQAHKITIINESEYFCFTPSNPWVAVGWRKRKDVSLEIGPYLKKQNINFIAEPVAKIDADACTLHFENLPDINYDYLVITTGPKLAFDEIPGFGPTNGFTQSICTLSHAESTYENYKAFIENPGAIVIGAVQGASCFGPAYEFSCILDADLRQRKIRHRVPITFVTSEPYIGHMGLGGVGDSKGLLESELRNKDIKWIVNSKITQVEKEVVHVSEYNEKGEVYKEHSLPFKYSMFIPAFKGVDAVAAVEGLCNPRGFVLIDEYQRSTKYTNIFAAGVCVAIPPVEQTTIPTGAPKTGYMIETMVEAIVENIASEIASKGATAKGTWGAICLADLGKSGVGFVAIPQIPPRNVTWGAKGKWVHLAKILYEKYFLYKMRRGRPEPLYEKYFLKAFGIGRLKK